MDREPDKNSSLIVVTKKIAIYIKLKKKNSWITTTCNIFTATEMVNIELS